MRYGAQHEETFSPEISLETGQEKMSREIVTEKRNTDTLFLPWHNVTAAGPPSFKSMSAKALQVSVMGLFSCGNRKARSSCC